VELIHARQAVLPCDDDLTYQRIVSGPVMLLHGARERVTRQVLHDVVISSFVASSYSSDCSFIPTPIVFIPRPLPK
jgi:hypothetical protein